MDDKTEFETSPSPEVKPVDWMRDRLGASTDKFVIYAALTLFGLWFLGQGLLWLIGGTTPDGGTNLASNTSSVVGGALGKLEPDEESSANWKAGADANGERGIEKKSDVGQRQPQGHLDLYGGQKNKAGSEKSNDIAAASKPAPETVLRPTYTEPKPRKESSPAKRVEPSKKAAEKSGRSWRDQAASSRRPEISETVPSVDLDSPSAKSKTDRKTHRPYPMRVWTSALGNKAKLSLVRVDGNNVVILDEYGKEWSLPFSRFSQEDQDYAREAFDRNAR